MDILPGWKSFIACAGLVGLGVYQISQNDLASAWQSFMAALAVYGVRMAAVRGK